MSSYVCKPGRIDRGSTDGVGDGEFDDAVIVLAENLPQEVAAALAQDGDRTGDGIRRRAELQARRHHDHVVMHGMVNLHPVTAVVELRIDEASQPALVDMSGDASSL